MRSSQREDGSNWEGEIGISEIEEVKNWQNLNSLTVEKIAMDIFKRNKSRGQENRAVGRALALYLAGHITSPLKSHPVSRAMQ